MLFLLDLHPFVDVPSQHDANNHSDEHEVDDRTPNYEKANVHHAEENAEHGGGLTVIDVGPSNSGPEKHPKRNFFVDHVDNKKRNGFVVVSVVIVHSLRQRWNSDEEEVAADGGSDIVQPRLSIFEVRVNEVDKH